MPFKHQDIDRHRGSENKRKTHYQQIPISMEFTSGNLQKVGRHLLFLRGLMKMSAEMLLKSTLGTRFFPNDPTARHIGSY